MLRNVNHASSEKDDIFSLTVEADVARGADKEGLEEVVVRELVDVGRDVDVATGHGTRATEAQQPVQVERGNLGVVTLVVAEVKVVRKSFLKKYEILETHSWLA